MDRAADNGVCGAAPGPHGPRGLIAPRGGVTSIYTGTGRAIFWGAFFEQEINFGVSFLVRL